MFKYVLVNNNTFLYASPQSEMSQSQTSSSSKSNNIVPPSPFDDDDMDDFDIYEDWQLSMYIYIYYTLVL